MLLAFDLDNTLVTVDHDLPHATIDAVAEARGAGHAVTVLTGRPEFAARPFVSCLGVEPGPFSVNHGATVFGADGARARERRLAREHVRAILASGYAPAGVPFSCVADDALYVDDPEDPRWTWAHTQNRNVLPFDAAAVEDVHKIVFGADGQAKAFERRLRRDHPVDTYLWGDGNLEITARHADKGSALQLITELLGASREETVAFGDGLNDVAMLRWAGHGVSVGPYAPPEVRRSAQEHVEGPESLGVAAWLRANLS